jgi:plastocyanin
MRRALPVVVLVGVFIAMPVGAVAADPVVEVRDNFYDPVTVTVPAGSTVVWEQTEFQPHTVTATDGSWDSHPDCGSNYEECMLYGDRYERSFPEPGTYDYFCRIHGTSMSGTVIVTEAEPSPTASPSPSPSPLPTVTVPAVTASPSPSPTAPRTSEQPSPSPSPSVEKPSSGTPSVEPSSPAASASPSVTPSASERPSASESDLPLGTPASDETSQGIGAWIVVLVALVAVGLGAFGYWQLRPAQRDTGA